MSFLPDFATAAGAAGFVFVGIVGVLLAKRPDIFARYFLADWQRERMAGDMDSARWVGWVIFGLCMFTVVMMLLEATIRR